MKTLLSAGVFLALPVLGLAQPTITRDNWPQVGDLLVAALCSDPVAPGPAGADQVWNMSGLQEEQEGFFDFVSPAGTPWELVYPTANVCTVNWLGAHTYQTVTASDWNVQGDAADFGGGVVFYSEYADPEQYAAFPYTYGSTFSDDFSGVDHFSALDTAFAGSVSFEADGYGTLILPTGTYANVLRYASHREELSGGVTEIEDQWTWVSADHRGVLLMMESITDDFGSDKLVWYNKGPVDLTPTADTSWGEVKSLY